jgi:hypothetical protein
MRTGFYERTAYGFLPIEAPECFINLEKYFYNNITGTQIFGNQITRLAENLSYRMADIDLYAYLILDANRKPNIWNPDSKIIRNDFKRAILVQSLLIAYFSACKSLFDSGAISLNQLYQLGLGNPKEQDFRRGKTLLKKLGQNT